MTISEADLRRISIELLDRARASGFRPDLLVGIATGGAVVMDCLCEASGIPGITCDVHRPTTTAKRRLKRLGLVARLPRRLSDQLRRLEHIALSSRPPAAPDPQALREPLDAIGAAIRAGGAGQILIVDDAVDSGATLVGVRDGIRQRVSPDVAVRTLAITRTRPAARTLIAPDYVMFDQVLCRFHWSLDYGTAR